MRKNGLVLVFVIVLVSLGVGQVWAEESFTDIRSSVIFNLGDDSFMGYKSPFIGLGIGADLQTKYLLLTVQGFVSHTDKRDYANLEQFYGEGRLMWVAGNLALGGGSTGSRLAFRDISYKRSAIRPFISAGFIFRNRSVIVDWVFPGQDEAYRIKQLRAHLEFAPLRKGKYVRLAYDVAYVVSNNPALKGRYCGETYHVEGTTHNIYLKFSIPVH